MSPPWGSFAPPGTRLDNLPTGWYVYSMNQPQSISRKGAGRSRGGRTKARIIELAAAAFADTGYEATSLNEIIRGSGLTKGAFYFHFRSKEDLSLQVFRAKQAQLVGRIREEAEEGADALVHLRSVLRTRARLLRDEPAFRGFLRLASDLAARHGPGSEYAASYGVGTGVFAEIVRRGQGEGVMRKDLDPVAAAEFIFSVLLGIDELSKALSGGGDLVGRTERALPLVVAALAEAGGAKSH